MTPRVFISHSSKDSEEAERIVTELERRGVQCWFAPREIEWSSDYADRILDGLESCDATVVLLSSDSVLSRHVRREIEHADNLEHRFYPIRLVDVVIAREIAYFLKADNWIDLHKGKPSKGLDEVAAAIKEGRDIGRQSAKRLHIRTRILAAAATLVLILFAYSVLNQLSVIEERLKAPIDEIAEEDRPAVSIDFMHQSRSFGDSLFTTNLRLEGIPLQNEPVEIAIYEELQNGTLRKIGETSQIPYFQGGYQSVDEVTLIDAPETVRICALYQANDDRMFLNGRWRTYRADDPERTVIVVDPAVSCDDAIGYVPDGSFAQALKKAAVLRHIEGHYNFATIAKITPGPKHRGGHEIWLNTTGATFSARLPQKVSIYMFGSDDGETWIPTFQTSGLGQNENKSRIISYFEYRRSLPSYVKLCVTSQLGGDEKIVHHQRVFRRFEETFVNSSDRETLNVNNRADTCLGGSAGPSFDSVSVTNPVEYIIPTRSKGKFDRAGRNAALASITGGIPKPYGPSIGDLRLGMSISEARAIARSLLPLSIVDSSVVDLGAEYGAGFEIESHSEEQTFQELTLIRSLASDALVGIRLDYSPKGLTPKASEVRKAAVAAFGPARFDKNWSLGIDAAGRFTWGDFANDKCNRLLQQMPNLHGLAVTLKARDCFGISIEYHTAYGGRGAIRYQLTLFDTEAATD